MDKNPPMDEVFRVKAIDRRDLVLGSGAAALLAGLLGTVPEARAVAGSVEFEAALAGLLKGATPRNGGIDMDLPGSINNGDYVPVALGVESPMTAESYVKAIHLLSPANPRARVATFKFTPLSGRARVTSVMRLAKTQEVVAVAELSDGTLLMGTRSVDVKVGGCGT
jgi:sulfur-oxidizing protein SoxY